MQWGWGPRERPHLPFGDGDDICIPGVGQLQGQVHDSHPFHPQHQHDEVEGSQPLYS